MTLLHMENDIYDEKEKENTNYINDDCGSYFNGRCFVHKSQGIHGQKGFNGRTGSIHYGDISYRAF